MTFQLNRSYGARFDLQEHDVNFWLTDLRMIDASEALSSRKVSSVERYLKASYSKSMARSSTHEAN